jgi:CBS domain-containing protein
MKVHDIMTTAPETCRPTTNLASAVEQLWRADCGALPVADDAGTLVGIITDRDICVALGTRNRPASTIPVGEVMRRSVEACHADDDVDLALDRMRNRRVRRLPVLDDDGKLAGIVSLNDIVRATGPGARAVKPSAVLQAFKAICTPSLPMVVRIKARDREYSLSERETPRPREHVRDGT